MNETMMGVFVLIGTFLVCEFILSFRRKSYVESVEKRLEESDEQIDDLQSARIFYAEKFTEIDDLISKNQGELEEHIRRQLDALSGIQTLFHEKFYENHKAIEKHTTEIKALNSQILEHTKKTNALGPGMLLLTE